MGPWRRLAAAPGRLARPAPPGNDDPCVARRTIPEGMPRLPREAFERGLRRAVPSRSPALAGLPAEASAKAKPTVASAKVGGQRRARARARNPTWSAERRASLRRDDETPRRRSGSPDLRISNAATGDLWCAMNARRASARACRSMRRLHAGHKRVHASCVSVYGMPIWVRRMHPSANGAPHAPREGANEEGRKERGEEK